MMIASLVLCVLTGAPSGALDSKQVDWEVEGVQRSARVHMPEPKEGQKAPLVFVFHGHGGNARGISRSLPVHQLWPEAIVVYPSRRSWITSSCQV
jgi:polyhydroxybutyrate depolymerase